MMKHDKITKRRFVAWILTAMLVFSSALNAVPAGALGFFKTPTEPGFESTNAYIRLSELPTPNNAVLEKTDETAREATPEPAQPDVDVQEQKMPATDETNGAAAETEATVTADQQVENTPAPDGDLAADPTDDPHFTYGYATVDRNSTLYTSKSKNSAALGKVTDSNAVVLVTERFGDGDGESDSDWLRVAFYAKDADTYAIGFSQAKSVEPLSDAQSESYIARYSGAENVDYFRQNKDIPLAAIGFAWHDTQGDAETPAPEVTPADTQTVAPEASPAPTETDSLDDPMATDALETPDATQENGLDAATEDLAAASLTHDAMLTAEDIALLSEETTNYGVSIEWDDANSDARPNSVALTLYQNGTPFDSATVTGMGSYWYYQFSGLPAKDQQDADYTYTVTQEAVSGYTTGYFAQPSWNDMRILNTVSGSIDLEARVLWLDSDPADRPASVTLTLQENDYYIVKTVTVTAADGWKYTFTDLPVARMGSVITYSITQNLVAGYTTSTLVDMAAGVLTVSNRKGDTTSITVTKQWDDNNNPDRPSDAYVWVQSATHSTGEYLNDANGWTHTFTLPKTVDGVTENVYTVQESSVWGYHTSYDMDSNGNITITNKLWDTVDITVQKQWDDNHNPDRPEQVYVELFNGAYNADWAELNASNGWSHTFSARKYYGDTMIPYQYAIREAYTEGYQPVITKDDASGTVTITNIPRQKIDVTVSKQWDDNNSPDRPASVTVWLLSDGQYLESVTLNSANSWSHTFTVNKMRDNYLGDVVYTAAEEPVEGYGPIYTAQARALVVTNRQREKKQIEVAKVWDDGNDPLRPTSVTMQLVSDGNVVDTVELNASNQWSHSFSVYKYLEDHTTPIQYTVTESPVERYYPTYETDSVTGKVTVTNRLRELTTRTVTKVWDDANATTRPADVTVHLRADGVSVGSATLNAANGWSHTFTAYRYQADNLTETVFTVAEDPVASYQRIYSEEDGSGQFVVTNKLLDNGLIDLSLSAGQNFRIRFAGSTDTMTLVMTYKPYLLGQSSSVTVYLPPAFSFSAVPPNTDDYTVTTATVALPAQYYDESEADILKAYSPSATKVTAVTFHYNASVNGQSITTLPVRVNDYANLSNLMVAYGADAANIPLKMIAEAKDAYGNVLDWDILAGDSRITNADGSAAYQAELQPSAQNTTFNFTNASYLNHYPYISTYTSYLYSLYDWHYPITDMVMYLPWPEGVKLGCVDTNEAK